MTSFYVSENPANDTKDGSVNREKKVCCLHLIQKNDSVRKQEVEQMIICH